MIKTCPVCGAGFIQKTYNQIYCSRVCTVKENIKKPKIEKTCKTCGKKYFIYPHQISISFYCSRKCYGINLRTKVNKVCLNCGKDFLFPPSQLKKYKGGGKYCSQKCAYEGIVKETRNKPIKDKYQRSNRKDDKEWQKAVRKKDNCVCKRCGKPDKYAHTHHVVPRSHSKELKHDISNGICLCNSCHTWVHNHPKDACKAGFLILDKYKEYRAAGINRESI